MVESRQRGRNTAEMTIKEKKAVVSSLNIVAKWLRKPWHRSHFMVVDDLPGHEDSIDIWG
jgi:hypothetical protein